MGFNSGFKGLMTWRVIKLRDNINITLTFLIIPYSPVYMGWEKAFCVLLKMNHMKSSLQTCSFLVQRRTNLMHNSFLVYFVSLYIFWAYLGPSSGGITVFIPQLGLIRWLSVVPVGLEQSNRDNRQSSKNNKYQLL